MSAGVPIKPLAASIVVGSLIFAFDILVPLGVASGVAYVALVLLRTWFPRESPFYVLASISTMLVIAGFLLSPEGGILWVVLTNRFLAFFVIWITAWQLVHRKRMEQDLREKEMELRRVSRMSDMGLMASALVHEINQPLTAISSYVQAARQESEAVERFLASTLTADVQRTRRSKEHVEVTGPVDGEQLFSRFGCQGCHQINGEGGSMGPNLSVTLQEKGEDFMIQKVLDPAADTPASTMPKFPISETGASAIIEHIKTLDKH